LTAINFSKTQSKGLEADIFLAPGESPFRDLVIIKNLQFRLDFQWDESLNYLKGSRHSLKALNHPTNS
jgi:hypothetical protein